MRLSDQRRSVRSPFLWNRRDFLGGYLAVGAASVMPLRAFAQNGQPSGAIVFGNAEPPTSSYWDPSAGFGLVDEQVASLVHDSLLTFDENGAIVPSLATAFDVRSDTVVALTLREGVRFHDGTLLSAEDVKASIDRLGKGKLAQSNVVTPGISVNIVSPTEIEVVSPQPFGVILNALAYIKILPKANIDNPDNFSVRALGSGPYKFVSYSGNDVILEANAQYWGELPRIRSVTFRYIEDAQARINALLSGQVDIITRVSSEHLARVKGNDNFYIVNQTPPAQIVLIYQHNGPLADVRVRHALAYAVDRRSIASAIMNAMNPVGQSSLPTSDVFYTPLEPAFEYDPEKARALLAEAGHASGLTLTMATSTLVPNQIEIDQVIAASLQLVGITVEIERLEVGTFRSTYNNYDLSMNALATFTNDADFILGHYVGGAGEAIFHFADPAYEALYAAQRAASQETRASAVTKAARYLWENQVTLYLADEVWYSIVNKRVEGYVRAPLVGENQLPRAFVS